VAAASSAHATTTTATVKRFFNFMAVLLKQAERVQSRSSAAEYSRV
jgi:hypothetical protein